MPVLKITGDALNLKQGSIAALAEFRKFKIFQSRGKTTVHQYSTQTMKHAPLTHAQLRVIQDRNRDDADTMTLLREIKRLHGILDNAWQVFDRLPPEPHNSPLDLLIGLVNNQPSVKESRAKYDRVGRMKQERG